MSHPINKATAVALAVAAGLTLSACNGSNDSNTESTSDQNNAERTNEAEPAGVGGTTNQ